MEFDYENRTVTTDDGTVLHMKKLSSLVVERLRSNESDKPKPPVQDVTYAGGIVAQEDNPNDPDYKEQLTRWEVNKSYLMMRYVLTEGVVENPPQEFMQRYRDLYMPSASDAELKYMWVASLVPDQDQVSLLMRVLMGQTLPTGEGLSEAAATFPSDG